MSKANLEQFMNQVADSEELQARIGEEIDTEALMRLVLNVVVSSPQRT